MKNLIPFSALVLVFGLTSCSNTGLAESPDEIASVNAQEINLDTYLQLPDSFSQHEEILRKEGYQLKQISSDKLVAVKKFDPAVIIFNEEGARMLTRTHHIEIMKKGSGHISSGTFTK